MATTIHEQVPVKVNTRVDRNIVPLVAAINNFDSVITSSSCEVGPGKIAWIQFTVGSGEWQELGTFINTLMSYIKQNAPDDVAKNCAMSVEWVGNAPIGFIRTPFESIGAVAQYVDRAASANKIPAPTPAPVPAPAPLPPNASSIKV